MKFTKMHGAGNDYIYINCFEEKVEDPAALSQKLSRRHLSVGSDGLILICPSDVADCRMEMYNADGSLGMMCGNGIRCVGKYVYERGICKKLNLSVETAAGIKTLEMTEENDEIKTVRVDMGAPILKPEDIPMNCGGESFINRPLEVGGIAYNVTCVSMGNPHAVVFMENVGWLDLHKIGPKFERHPMFPKGVNTEFVEVIDRDTLKMRVWERGSGETLACGTGSCASLVASVLNGKTNDKVKLILAGGELFVEWDRDENRVYLTGGAEIVYDGELKI